MNEREHLLDLVEQLEREVLDLDRSGDGSSVHLIFRTVHNLKSTTAYVGLAEAAQAFHELEDALDRIRRGKAIWDASWSDRLLAAIDLTRKHLDVSADPPTRPGYTPSALQPTGAWGMSLTQTEQEALSLALLNGHGVFRLEKLFRKGIPRATFDSLPVLENIREQGILIAIRPTWEVFEAGPEEQVFRFLMTSRKSHAELSDVFFDPLIELQAASSDEEPHNPIRSLIIEDDVTTRLILEEALKPHGPCQFATTAREGFALFRKAWEHREPFQLLLLDLMLPDLNGNAVLRALRQFEAEQRVPLEKRCMVVVNTASEEMSDLRTSLSLDADGYLLKPIAMEQLDEKLMALRKRLKL